ncbi:uncharacterized protein TM35_000064780 [Trypanosoma theileri]|uniref:Uncharacterized protein n=1 Tax=Trypanosoma theileri TaxID=67003 RepID=A0A1X0P487_9TRYP|nr:uncharacterized protein TM35_000064780 [Trypanosoma theileri]ORC91473.1 hypothetical protein TM35_000064780 [Trypanosoma theileri]
MFAALGIVAEDDEAHRIASEFIEASKEPIFKNNNGPYVEVWFGDQKLFGLVERTAPNDFIQTACEMSDGDCNNDNDEEKKTSSSLHITQNVSFVLRLSSVSHDALSFRAQPEDSFMNCVNLVVDYAEMLRSGMQDEFAGSDAEAEYVRFKEK